MAVIEYINSPMLDNRNNEHSDMFGVVFDPGNAKRQAEIEAEQKQSYWDFVLLFDLCKSCYSQLCHSP